MIALDWLDFEVETNEGEHETLQVLHQIIEAAQTIRVPAKANALNQASQINYLRINAIIKDVEHHNIRMTSLPIRLNYFELIKYLQ